MGTNGVDFDDFDDLDDYLTPELRLPIGGVVYAIAPSANLVLRIRRWYADPEAGADDIITLQAEMIGADYDPDTKVMTARPGSLLEQMESSEVSGEQTLRLCTTASMWFGMSHEMAQRFWKTGSVLDPNSTSPEKDTAPAANQNRATRRSSSSKRDSAKARTAGTTRSPAHTD